MPVTSLPFFLVAAFLAEIMGTMAGFGAATVLTPIASLFMDIKTAIVLVAIFHVFGNAARVSMFVRHIHWRLFALFGSASILCALLGATLAADASSAVLRGLLGGFLLVFVAISVAAPMWKLPGTIPVVVVGGMASGFVAGVLGTGGAIRATILTAFQLPPQTYLATSAIIALVVDSTRIPIYLRQGWLSREYAGVLVALLVVAFAGAWVGRRLVRHIPAAHFRTFVLVMLALMGVKLLLEGLRG